MKIYGTKPNRKNGIYSSGRRGKKEEEDAVGTLWLRLGEDSTRENLTVGVGEVEEGETGVPLLSVGFTFPPNAEKRTPKKVGCRGWRLLNRPSAEDAAPHHSNEAIRITALSCKD